MQKGEYSTTTPGLCVHIPSSPTSSSDGPSWFSFLKEADPVLKSVRVEAGIEDGIKGAVGVVSGVVN